MQSSIVRSSVVSYPDTILFYPDRQIRKELFIVDEEQKHVQFAKTFLVGWDNSLSNQQVILLLFLLLLVVMVMVVVATVVLMSVLTPSRSSRSFTIPMQYDLTLPHFVVENAIHVSYVCKDRTSTQVALFSLQLHYAH